MKRGFLVTAGVAVTASACWVAVAMATPPGSPARLTDTTNPATRVVTPLGMLPDGTVLRKTTIDGAFAGAMTGPFHTTILSVRHPNGITDTSGVDYCTACVDLSGNTLFARGATIAGPVRVDDASAVSLCGNEIIGPLRISGSVGPTLVGEPASGDCTGNTIVGPVGLTGNRTGLDFSGNTVDGPLEATNNVGGFVFGEVAPNTISGPVTTGGNVRADARRTAGAVRPAVPVVC